MGRILNRIIGVGIVLLGGILAATGVGLGFAELRAQQLHVRSDLENNDPGLLSWLSTRGQYAVVQACWLETKSLRALLLPKERRAQAAVTCRASMAGILRVSPANAFAITMDAYLAAKLGDIDGFRDGIAKSALIAPYENWLAQQRFETIEANLAAADAETLAIESRDISLLVASYSYVAGVAKRYIREPQFRSRVAKIVEGLSEDVQRRFVRNIERAMSELGMRKS